jgi:dihydroorotase-like cyclic amidohydrolase
MPSAILNPRERITKFTNCRLVRGNQLVEQDLWVSSGSGKIVRSQEVFYSENTVPDVTVNLGGRIISPGMIDVQLNGAFGFNFSQIPEPGVSYEKSLRQVNKSLVHSGVTSYLPTVTSEQKEVYHRVSFVANPQSKMLTRIRSSLSSAHQKVNESQRMAPNPSERTSRARFSILRRTAFTRWRTSSLPTASRTSRTATVPPT